MSTKGILAAILAETKRRKKIWKKLDEVAQDALKEVQKEAARRGVRGKKWVSGDERGSGVMFDFDGLKGGRSLLVLVSPNGRCGWSRVERNENKMCEGYPDVDDSAAELFGPALVKALLENLTTYCDAQKSKSRKKKK